MSVTSWRGIILVLIWCSCISDVEGQCTRDQLDRVEEEVAICVARQQEMVREVETIFVGDIYAQVRLQMHGAAFPLYFIYHHLHRFAVPF